jgi:predicted ATPase/class 3 adenylate cyclase
MLMFTDIEDSTKLWERYPTALLALKQRHDSLILEALPRFDGQMVKNLGDGFFLTFEAPLDALHFSVHIQQMFREESWPLLSHGEALRIRIGLHHGDPLYWDNDLLGLPVNRTARICAAGHGGQILVSEAAYRALHPVCPEEIRLENLGSFKLKGFSRFETIYQARNKDHKVSFPPLKALSLALPPERNTFVGRKEVLTYVERQFSVTGTRLITLTGMGGMGKSRTALRLTHLLKSRFEAGAYVIELAPLTSKTELLPLLLHSLGVVISPDGDPYNAVAELMDNRPMLLVLDNLEHLDGIDQIISELLDRCPSLHILATSRVALSTWQQQQQVELPPLEVPDPADDFAKIRRAKCVQLFVARAKNIDRSFRLTSENACAVAEICRITAGIPLALELAAQLIHAYEPADLASRLQNTLLEVETRTPEIPARLRSLRAAFDYSYQLLSQERKDLLASLLVFRGDFTLQAVEGVCADLFGDVDAAWRGLLEHRWVERQRKHDKLRYRLLEPVAEYVRERAGFPSEVLCKSHADYYLRVARDIDRQFRSRDITTAFRRLYDELENFRVALRWACNVGAHALVAQLGAALSNVMLDAGLWHEFTGWVGLAIRSAESLESGTLFSQLVTVKGLMAERRGDRQMALACHKLALEHAQGNDRDMMRAHINLARLAHETGDLDSCAGHAEEVIRIAPLCGMQADAGLGYIFLASIKEREGDLTAAERLWQQARIGFDETRDEWGLAHWERERGQAKELSGDSNAAKRYYGACLRRYARLGLQQHITQVLGRLAMLALHQDDLQLCAQSLAVANRFSGILYSELKVLTDVAYEFRSKVGADVVRQLLEAVRLTSLESILEGLNGKEREGDRTHLAVVRTTTAPDRSEATAL